MEFSQKTNHHINIRPTSNGGFVADIGCCTRSYTETKDLIADLESFLNDPQTVEKQYNEFCNNMHNGNVPELAQPTATIV